MVDAGTCLNPSDACCLKPWVQTALHSVQCVGTSRKRHDRIHPGIARAKSREEPVPAKTQRKASVVANHLNKSSQYRVCEVDHFVFVIPEAAPREVSQVKKHCRKRRDSPITHLQLFKLRMPQSLRLQSRGDRRLDGSVAGLATAEIAHDSIAKLICRQNAHR